MKESCHLRSDTPIHIINKCIKDASFPVLWDNIIISYCSRYQSAITLFEQNFFSSASYLNLTVALNTHGYGKTIVFLQIPMEWLRDLHHSHTEIRGVYYLNCLVRTLSIICSIVVFYFEIKSLGCKFCVQLTWFPVHSWAVGNHRFYT